MNLFRRKPRDVIPNPRSKIRRQEYFERTERAVLHVAIFFCFALAFMILAEVSYAPL